MGSQEGQRGSGSDGAVPAHSCDGDTAVRGAPAALLWGGSDCPRWAEYLEGVCARCIHWCGGVCRHHRVLTAPGETCTEGECARPISNIRIGNVIAKSQGG